MTKRSREEFEKEVEKENEIEIQKNELIKNLLLKLKKEVEQSDDDEEYIICESLTKN
jgi:hypothetical protein